MLFSSDHIDSFYELSMQIIHQGQEINSFIKKILNLRELFPTNHKIVDAKRKRSIDKSQQANDY
jgi:hypothetical protein